MIIVGTHVDHPALSRTTLEQIWNQLRQLLSEARAHHQCYFREADRLSDCLLCQTDSQCPSRSDLPPAPDSDPSDVGTDQGQNGGCFINHGFDAGDNVAQRSTASDVNDAVAHSDDDDDDDVDDEALLSNGLRNHDDNNNDKQSLMFPHIVGYYEVNCTARGQGIGHLRDGLTELASKLIANNPDIPRRWLNVERSLVARAERSGSVCRLDELKDIASVQGVSDPHDVLNMIHFFRAQGRILYFPQVSTLFPPFVSRLCASCV